MNLFEEIVAKAEEIAATRYGKLIFSNLENMDKQKLVQAINGYEKLALRKDGQSLKGKLKEIIPTFRIEE